ncbi:hypothetical protein THS27_08315 [Thalassospira sp. MCCC 1A01428]|nr:hypothetical protein THS27_08315 [Thalassospira sp. MCCC 1A01428]
MALFAVFLSLDYHVIWGDGGMEPDLRGCLPGWILCAGMAENIWLWGILCQIFLFCHDDAVISMFDRASLGEQPVKLVGSQWA